MADPEDERDDSPAEEGPTDDSPTEAGPTDDEAGPEEFDADSRSDDGDADEGPAGEDVDVTIEPEDGQEEADEAFGGGAAPGEDPYAPGPDADEEEYGPDEEDRRAAERRSWADEDGVRSEFDRLWEELEGLEDDVRGRTVSRSDFEAEMKQYVRWKLRRGHVTGWGPYVVLLYGTGMTLGAFFYLDGLWAILAMLVVWLSTLGLYVVMVVLGIGIGSLRIALKYADKARTLRS